MDHIRCIGRDPWPKEVPYLIDPSAPYVYDNGQWSTYHHRVGWTYQELRDFNPNQPSQNPEHTPARAASLLQAWLYFGFIHAITEIPIDTQRYVTTTAEGRQIVSTACLPGHLEQWRDHLGKKSDDDAAGHVEQLDHLFKTIYIALNQVVKISDCVLPPEVCFSIQILWTTLMTFKKRLFPNSTFPKEISFPNANDKIRERLRSKGYCMVDVQRLGQTFNSLTSYYIGASEPRKTSRNHSNCDTNRCKALQLGLDTDHVKQIIARNRIPVLYYSEQCRLELSAIDPNEHSQDIYIAISHVWADGLGNPHGNSMNQCQLRLMQERVSNIARRVQEAMSSHTISKAWFWIDTLCVPAEESPEKTAAIVSMERVYKEAAAVLVIDSDLELIDDLFSPAHIAVMIASSVWLTRLWTVQEAAFAKEVYFQLHNVAVTETELRRVIAKAGYSLRGPSALRWDSDAMIISNALSKFPYLRLDQIRSGHGVNFLRNMQWRFTTRAADEAICLAILFGFSSDRIAFLHKLPKDPNERMRHFLLMQKYVPKEIIFWGEDRDNVAFDGMPWAPSTFLGRQGGNLSAFYRDPFMEDSEALIAQNLSSTEDAFVDDQGLHVQFPGLVFTLEKYNEKGKPNLDMFVEDISAHYVARLVSNKSIRRPTWDMFFNMKNPMIILPLEASSSQPLVANLIRIGVLVDAIVHSGDEIRCLFKMIVICFGIARKVNSIDEVASQARAQSVIARNISNQEWCIQ